MKIKNFLVSAAFLSAVILGPIVVFADHAVDHTLQQLQTGFHATFESFLTARAGVASGSTLASLLAAVDGSSIKKLEDELQSYQSRIQELKLKSQSASDAREIKSLEDEVNFVQSKLEEARNDSGLNLTRTLQRGSSGNEVRHLQEFLAKDKEIYPNGLATGYFGKLTEDAVKKFQEKNGIDPVGIVGPKTREKLNELSATSAVSPSKEISESVRTLQRGSSGDDVKKLQGFLKKFPDLYPQGLVSGYFGPASEAAIQKLQKQFGIEVDGQAGRKTREKISALERAVNRKQQPKITAVSPADISLGTTVTLTGSGFTLESNSLFVRGKTVLSNLISADGTTIVSSIPDDIPCGVGPACPLKIINSNGISNAKVIKLVAAVAPPTPEPTPEPTPTPTVKQTNVRCEIEYNTNVPHETMCSVNYNGQSASCTIPAASSGYHLCDPTPLIMIAQPEPNVGSSPVPGLSGIFTGINCTKNETIYNTTYYFVECYGPSALVNKVSAPTVSLSANQITVATGKPFTLTVSGTSDVGLASVWWYGNATGVIDANVVSLYPSTPTPVYTSPDLNPAKLDKAYMASFTAAQAVKSYSFSSIITIPAAGVYEFGANSRDVLYPVAGEPHQASEGAGLATLKITVVAPTPPPPTLTSISPSIATTGTRVTLIGANFTQTGNTVTFTGSFTEPNQIIAGVASSDGVTVDVTIPSTMPCQPTVVSQCSIFVTNQNGKSNLLTFWLGQYIDQVTVITPNGGEKLTQGVSATVSASGGKSEAFGGAVSISYALVEASATTASDPSALIVGWIQHDGSAFLWDAKKVCDFDNANSALPASGTCWDVVPGTYKILAVGKDMLNLGTIWDQAAQAPGNIDVSDASFTIAVPPQPVLGVVSPNGGEAFKRGDAVTITWRAENIASRSVNIKLLKAGVLAQTITSNVPQGTETGMFLYTWIIPSTLAVGFDYTIEISDAANAVMKDVSDGNFRIASSASLSVLSPNGGETMMRGFVIPLFWDYSGYSPASITVNLYKGGSFYRTLATGIKPTGFSGSTFLYLFPSRLPSGNYARYAEVPVPLDIMEGADYTIEIIDGADSFIRDAGDAPFRIVSITSPITFSGRLIDALSGVPLPGVQFSGYSGGSNLDGTSYNITLPRFITDANGGFSYATTTDDFVAKTRSRTILAGWPACNDVVVSSLFRYPDLPRATTNAGYYNWIYPKPSAFDPYYPLTTSTIDFGNLTLWPTTQYIITFSDIPSAFYLQYQKLDGTFSGGSGNSGYTTEHMLSKAIPLDTNAKVQFVDQAGRQYLSPSTIVSSASRCQNVVLSFMDGTFQWEPYAIGITYSFNGAYVGQPFSATLKTSASAPYSSGTAPFAWRLLPSSQLPPGLVFDTAAGIISGTPTTAGTYYVPVGIVDANGVRATRSLSIIVK